MQPVHPYRPNIFSGAPLDRVDAQRKKPADIDAYLAADATVFVPTWRSRSWVEGEGNTLSAAFMPGAVARSYLARMPWALLGRDVERAYVCVDLSSLDTPMLPEAPGRFEDLRRMGGLLPEHDAAMLAYARGLMHWRTRTRFCSVCGATCLAQSAGHVMACSGCGTHHFPRSDPAVIMLVTFRDRILLGQPARFRNLRMFTTLAGFVEPGESLEEAVAREVYEEAGLRVGNVRYQSSQPWPFPASIMLGFVAEAEDDRITIDPGELVEAGWFSRDQLRSPDGFVLPPDLSIARRLIDDWVNSQPETWGKPRSAAFA